MNLYWIGVLVYIFGAAAGAMIMWVRCKDVKDENKKLRSQLDNYENQSYWERD